MDEQQDPALTAFAERLAASMAVLAANGWCLYRLNGLWCVDRDPYMLGGEANLARNCATPWEAVEAAEAAPGGG